MTFPLVSRARRLAVLGPAVLASWSVLVGLPLAPQAARPGHLETTTIALTGRRRPAPAAPPPGPPTGCLDLGRGRRRHPDGGADLGRRHDRRRRGLRIRSRGTDGTWTGWEELEADERLDEGPDAGSAEQGNGRPGHRSDLARHRRAPNRSTSGSTSGVLRRPVDAGDALDRSGRPPSGGRRPGPSPPGPASSAATRGRPAGGGATTPAARTSRRGPTACASRSCTTRSTPTTTRSRRSPGSSPASTSTTPARSAGATSPTTSSSTASVAPGRAAAATSALPIIGGHSKGFNTGSVGVAFLGQYQPGASPPAASPTQGALTALYELLAWKFSIHGVNPQGQRHRRERRQHEVPRGRGR